MNDGHHEQYVAVRHGQVNKVAARRRRRRRAIVGVGVVLALGVASAIAFRTQPGGGLAAALTFGAVGGCTEPVELAVATTASDAVLLDAVADRLASRTEESTLPCVDLAVVRAGVGDDGVAEIEPGVGALFGGVGSFAALDAGARASGATITERTAVASTVAVLAMPRAMAQAAGWADGPVPWEEIATTILDPDAWSSFGRPELGTFTISLADPATAGATRANLVGLEAGILGRPMDEIATEHVGVPEAQGALLTLDHQVTRSTPDEAALLEALVAADVADDLVTSTSVAFLAESSVWQYNSGDPATALLAVYPEGGAASLDLTWATLDEKDLTDSQRAAAGEVGGYLLSSEGQDLIAKYGFRQPDGSPSERLTVDRGISPDAGEDAIQLPAAVLDASAAGWQQLRNPGRFLVVVDVSGSMAETVVGTGRTKLQFAQDAAVQGMRLVPSAAEIGLWEFATGLDGASDFHALVPVGAIGDKVGDQTRLDQLTSAVAGLTPRSDTALYDTALAAFRHMRETYQAGEPNVIILITDGRNDDPSSIGLDALLAAMAAEQDDKQPVRMLTLAYGSDADTASLAQIAEVTGGEAFTSPNPADIGTVFFQALTSS